MKRFFLLILNSTKVLPLLLFLASSTGLNAQSCNPDTIPPVPACVLSTVVSVGVDEPDDCYVADGVTHFAGVTWVRVQAFDNGSYDNCSNILLTVQRAAPYSDCINSLNVVNGHPPCSDQFPDFPSEFERAISENDSIKFYCCEVGTTQTVIFRAYQLDSTGHIAYYSSGLPIVSQCLMTVEVVDKIKPANTAPSNRTISNEAFDALNIDINDAAQMNAAFGTPAIIDNCALDTVVYAVSATNYGDAPCDFYSKIVRSFTAYDAAGNNPVTRTQTITLRPDYTFQIPADFQPGDPAPDTVVLIGGNHANLSAIYSDEQIYYDCDTLPDLRLRNWSIVNGCGYNPQGPVLTLPSLDLDGDSLTGDAYTVLAHGDSVFVVENGQPTLFLGLRPAEQYQYQQHIRLTNAQEQQYSVQGKVFIDLLENCEFAAPEPTLKNRKVTAIGQTTGNIYANFTDSNGDYLIQVPCPEDTIVDLQLDLPYNYGQSCGTIYPVPLVNGQTSVQDIPVRLNLECPILTVDISAPFLRRCFRNQYTVSACNLSYQTIQNVRVEVKLDQYLIFNNATIAGTPVGNNTYSFDLGDMAAGDCQNFYIFVDMNCDEVPVRYTHCTEAHIYPDAFCGGASNWSGADIHVNGTCDGDTVRMSITNAGFADMPQALDFVVVEDVIMFQAGTFQLNAGQSKDFTIPANGATWRLQADQEPGHPWSGVAAVAVEGCAGLNMPGLVTQFPLSTSNPFLSKDCQENISSLDPNDKQAFPRGYGDKHYIEANTDLEYLIRFQNTGTDTAFTVIILDTLSAHLDPGSVRPGAASHPFSFSMPDSNVLRFRFDNILLPDSNVNELASHGFVKFRAPQVADNPDGTLIENRAAIYFDFNEAVLTNTVFHEIGREFIILVSTDGGPENDSNALRVYPNPAVDAVYFDLNDAGARGLFSLANPYGQDLRQEYFSDGKYRFERGKLPAGMYWYTMTVDNGRTYTGKIYLK